jgi:hypothetical protein
MVNYDPKRSVLLRGGQLTYLGNLFNDYCQAGAEQKKQILGNTLARLREKKEDISIERGGIQGRGGPFARCLVLDFPEYVLMVSPENLKTWGVSFDEPYAGHRCAITMARLC